MILPKQLKKSSLTIKEREKLESEARTQVEEKIAQRILTIDEQIKEKQEPIVLDKKNNRRNYKRTLRS